MEVPLTPLEFMRRTRKLYPSREGVVDGAQRWTYGEFFERCDRWSSALQRLGVKPACGLCCIARLFDVGVAVSKDLVPELVPGNG